MNYILGIDLGGSSIKTVAVTPGGQTLVKTSVNFDPDEERNWAEKIRLTVQTIQSELVTPPARIGLSAPGLAAA